MDLYLEERRQQMYGRILEQGRASVNELSQQFKVSEVTVRGDLQVLEKMGLIVRTHGGAILTSPEMRDLALSKRLEKQIEEKSRIGHAGAALIFPGETIYLDSSSTALSIARLLKHQFDLTVITNSLVVAQELLEAPRINVLMPGGLLQRDTQSIVGTSGMKFLARFNILKGFFGAHGLSLTDGLSDISSSEAEIKQCIIPYCQEVYCVVDATKWGRTGLASFAPINQVKHIISDTGAPVDMVEAIRSLGIEVTLV